MTDPWPEVCLGEIVTAHRNSVNPARLGETVVDHYSLPAFDAGACPERVPASAIGSNKFSMPKGAVLVSRLNPHIPRVWAPKLDPSVASLCSMEFAVLTANGCDPDFLKYFIESEDIYGRLGETMNGTSSSHQRVSLDDLLALRGKLPPLATQRRIAEVLAALDSCIVAALRLEQHLLERGLLTLEQLLDKEPTRSIPVSEAATFLNNKRIPLSQMERNTRPGSYPYHGATGVFGYVDDYLFEGTHILVGEDGSVIEDDGTPVLQLVSGKFWVNNHAHVLQGKVIPTASLWFALRMLQVDPAVTGAVQPKLSMGRLGALMLTYPVNSAKFDGVADMTIGLVLTQRAKRRALEDLREFMLPRLTAGDLSVEGAAELESATA